MRNVAKHTRYRHRKLTCTAELAVKGVIFGRSEKKLLLGECKNKVFFEDACQNITIELSCIYLSICHLAWAKKFIAGKKVHR